MAPITERLPRVAARSTAAALVLLGGCILVPGRRLASEAPDTAEVRAAAERPPAPPPRAAPEPAPAAAAPAPRSLADLVDLALSTHPGTRATWHAARQAAAQDAYALTAFLPTIDVSGSLTTARTPFRTSGGLVEFRSTTIGPSATATWILFDLGAVSAARQTASVLAAANLAHRAAVLDLVLAVETAYYQYLGSQALVASEQVAVKQAQTSLDAAEERRRAGVATIADVLQAKTALSQAQLLLRSYQGQALAFRGQLATLAGLGPTAPLDVGELPSQVAISKALPAVEDLIAQAEAANPNLGQSRALADAASAHASAIAGTYLVPSLVATGNVSRPTYLEPSGTPSSLAWSAGLSLQWRLFEGLGLRAAYDAAQAREAAAAARDQAEAARQQVDLSVWTSFQATRTAADRVATARDLVQSAATNAEVATARYRQGVGSILDLLTAQAGLEAARAEEVGARADWLVAVAQLARTTGRLAPEGVLPRSSSRGPLIPSVGPEARSRGTTSPPNPTSPPSSPLIPSVGPEARSRGTTSPPNPTSPPSSPLIPSVGPEARSRGTTPTPTPTPTPNPSPPAPPPDQKPQRTSP